MGSQGKKSLLFRTLASGARMAENSKRNETCTLSPPTPSETSASGDDPPTTTTTSICHDPKKEGPDSAPEPKRRKNCPGVLDKIQEPENFNFTFDTKFNGCTPQFTPKFGSFNLGLPGKEKVKEGAGKREREEEEEAEIPGKRELVSSLRPVDGIKGFE